MSETKEQIEVSKWFVRRWPEHAHSLRPSMNGLSRRGRAGAVLWASMRALGASKGNLDFAILVPKGGYGCFLSEHKGEGQTHKLTEEQAEQVEYNNRVGNCAVVTRGVEALKAAIEQYMGQ